MRLRIVLYGITCWISAATVVMAADPLSVTFENIQAVVDGYFQANLRYKNGDLIVQGNIVEVLAMVEDAGWVVPGGDKLAARGLPNDSFLAREFATPDGRQFMRKIARFPGAYSRLDRLSTISGGEKVISDLIKKRDGDKLIEYLATTKQGHNLGQMMSDVRHGVDLNKPTGRIYTQDELMAELKRLFRK